MTPGQKGSATTTRTIRFALSTVALAAVLAGCGATQASVIRDSAIRPNASQPNSSQPSAVRTGAAAQRATTPPVATYPVHAHPAAARPSASPSSPSASSDPALAWLVSPGGQEQVTFNDEVSTLAGDLAIEDQAPTAANHVAFERDARAMRAEAEKILATPALLPATNRAAYQRMLRDFITVANLLQPGPGYGTTAQDWAAWNTALAASNIIVS